jgi:hypothetical protein
MDLFLPPYTKTKKFILGAAALTLTLYLSVLLLASGVGFRSTTPKSAAVTKASVISAKSLKSDYSDSFTVAQKGKFDVAWYKSGLVMIDVRPREAYITGHVTGALSTPLSQLEYSVFTPDTKLVVYGSSMDDINAAFPVLQRYELTSVQYLTTPLDDLEKDGVKLTKESARP